MGQSYAEKEASFGDFVITKSNPGGNVVLFTIADPCVLLTISKHIRMVVNDAIQQWIDSERADLDSNGDGVVKGAEEFAGVGDGFSQFTYNFSAKTASVDLTALTSISISGDITASIPYADVI